MQATTHCPTDPGSLSDRYFPPRTLSVALREREVELRDRVEHLEELLDRCDPGWREDEDDDDEEGAR